MDLYRGMDQLRDLTKLYMEMKNPRKEEEEWEGSKEDKEEDKKLAKKHNMSLKDWEKSDADKKHDAGEKEEKESKEKESEDEESEDKKEKGKKKSEKEDVKEAEQWIQGAIKKPGALHRQLGVPQGEKIPAGKLSAAAKKGGKLGQRARLAQTLKGLGEGIDFKGAAREQARRDAEQEKKDKEVPTNKERRLAMGRFRPGASSSERAEGGRDALKQKGKVPTKGGQPMFNNFEIMADYLISEGQVQSVQEASEFLAGAPQEFLKDVLRFAEQRMLFMAYLIETGHCADLTEAASVYDESDPQLIRDVIDSIIAE